MRVHKSVNCHTVNESSLQLTNCAHIQTPIEFMIHIHSMNNAIIPKESRCKLGACVRSVCIGYPPVQCVLLHFGNLPLVSVYFAQNGIADTK